LNGISNWGVGDWATYNGSVWQRVEGGADLNGVNLSVSGTSTLSALTASTALALNASKEIVSVINTGTGNNVLATTPTLVGDVSLSTGNLVVSNGKGIDFSATPGTGTSELFDDYEEGDYNPSITPSGSGSITLSGSWDGLSYTKIGRQVTVQGMILGSSVSSPVGTSVAISLPFANSSLGKGRSRVSGTTLFLPDPPGTAFTRLDTILLEGSSSLVVTIDASTITANDQFWINFTYFTA
jgi:hypothetical protein